MFNLRNFVMDTLVAMYDTEPEYQVRRYALSWFQRDVLTEEDMTEVESWYEEEIAFANGFEDEEPEATEEEEGQGEPG